MWFVKQAFCEETTIRDMIVFDLCSYFRRLEEDPAGETREGSFADIVLIMEQLQVVSSNSLLIAGS